MFSESIINAAREHALAEYPKESCGVVSGDDYIPCLNIADDPLKDFKIGTDALAPYIIAGTLLAVIHSHPHVQFAAPSCPSSGDMQGQLDTAVPWGVIDTDGTIAAEPWWFGDFVLNEPLLGRVFQHGVRDCYSLIRAWYWQNRGVKLPEFPRGEEWWKDGGDLYTQGFAAAGFHKIAQKELRDGDVVLRRFRSPRIINHGGIYLDNPTDGKGAFLHHLPYRLSCRVVSGPWINGADYFLRYSNDA